MQKQKINWQLVGSLLTGLRRFLLLGALSVLCSTILSYLIPLVSSFTIDYVIGGQVSALPVFLQPITSLFGNREMLVENLAVCAAVLVLLTLLNGLFTFLRNRSIALVSEGIAKTLRDKLYAHLQAVPYDYHKHTSTGDLVQRCTSDVDMVRRFIGMQLLEIVRALTMVAVAATIMFSIHVPMALLSISTLPFLCIISFIYYKKVRKYFTYSDEAEGALSAALQENLTGVRVVRAFGQQKSELDKFTEKNRAYRNITAKLNTLLGIYWGGTDGLGYLQIAISTLAGIYFAATQGFSLGNVLVFTTYTSMLTWPVRQLGRILSDLGKAGVSLGRLDEILSSEPEKEPGKALRPKIIGNIEYRHVCFGYHRFDDVLKDISFSVKAGQTIAILGSTGSGKTSLIHLLQRLYQCTSGEILIDGVNINDIEHEHLRRNIGIVLQEPFLYSRTIMENIRMAAPYASNEEVYSVAKAAAIHDVIRRFDLGYDTVVGERGVTLSGGQQQRVAIARTLMQRAPILIFDDSMSAVDTETDAAIRSALASIRGTCTTFIISHRITTLRESDNIFVLDDGRLVQQGTHEQLMAQDGIYRRIAQIQSMQKIDLEKGDAI